MLSVGPNNSSKARTYHNSPKRPASTQWEQAQNTKPNQSAHLRSIFNTCGDWYWLSRDNPLARRASGAPPFAPAVGHICLHASMQTSMQAPGTKQRENANVHKRICPPLQTSPRLAVALSLPHRTLPPRWHAMKVWSPQS